MYKLLSILFFAVIFSIIFTYTAFATTPPNSPKQLTPPHNVGWVDSGALPAGNITFTWQDNGDAENNPLWFYFYLIKWNGTAWIAHITTYASAQGVTTITRNLTEGNYAWQVAAVDATQSSSPWHAWADRNEDGLVTSADWSFLKVKSVSSATSCLTQSGPLITFTGEQPKYTNYTLAPNTKIDARTASWASDVLDARVRVGAENLCWSGGKITGMFPENMSWGKFHDTYALTVRNSSNAIIEGIRIHNYGDSINMTRDIANLGTSIGDGWVIRGNHISFSHDDCIQNDFGESGLVQDNLIDGCFMGYSSRPQAISNDGEGNVVRYDVQAHDKIVTFRNNLIRLQVMPTSYKDRGPGHAHFWKTDPAHTDPQLSLHDNIFRVDSRPLSPASNGIALIPTAEYLVSCSNNIIVWLGSGSFPEPLPSCYTLTTDISVWNNAKQAWLDSHPNVAP